MNSLERSLQAGLVVSLAVLLLLFWWAGALASRLLIENVIYAELEAEGETLLKALEIDADGQVRINREQLRLRAAYEEPGSGYYFQILLDTEGEIDSGSMGRRILSWQRLAPGQQMRRRLQIGTADPLLMWRAGFSRQGTRFTITIAENVASIEQRLRTFQWLFAGISMILVVALVCIQHLIVRRSIRKLDAIRGDIARLEHGQIMALAEDVPSEILPLVREFNRLLNRFEQRLRQSRNAVGNLAHALKGPLNLLVRASESSSPASPDDRQAMIEQNVERIRQFIESELRRARVAGRGAAGQRFDLNQELTSLSGLLGHVYADKSVDIRLMIGSGAELLHDRQDMLELFGNLLDNAVKWASSVVILQVRNARGVLIEVEDDGPGCSPDEIRWLTRRGVRLDESVTGHGLGLSIVKDIVDTYNGSLEFGQSTRLGGLSVTVYLPLNE